MLGHRELTVQDYVAILKRWYWLILLCALVCCGVAFGITYELAPRYMSQTLVLIEQQQVPTDYVTPILTEDLGERLASLREQILSRSRLEPIIQRFNLFASGGGTVDARVTETQKAIQVKPVNAGARAGFFITFEYPDPRTAQQVCGEITSLFVSENLAARQESAEGTTEFLKQQLDDAKKNLDDQDAKLAAFEGKYLGRLPDQEKSNESTLQALSTQLDAATQSLDRLQENQTFIESNIAELRREMRESGSGGLISVDDRLKELRDLQEQKKSLDALYTPDYPDVQAVDRKIAQLQAEIAKSPSRTSSGKTESAKVTVDPPQLQQAKAQLRAVQLAIASTKGEQSKIKAQIDQYEQRIESSPIVEEQYKQVTRDHDIAQEFYNSLLKKINESSMAVALEHRQEGEQFRVMDPPNLPDAPSYPNRMKFAGAGLVGGLALGFMLVALLEYRDVTLRSELDVWAFTKLPTLAILSHIDGLPRSTKDQDGGKDFSRTDTPAESVGD
jgi:polysaccharide chain length determinant protein (PEP-CTERM system associated)